MGGAAAELIAAARDGILDAVPAGSHHAARALSSQLTSDILRTAWKAVERIRDSSRPPTSEQRRNLARWCAGNNTSADSSTGHPPSADLRPRRRWTILSRRKKSVNIVKRPVVGLKSWLSIVTIKGHGFREPTHALRDRQGFERRQV